MIWIEWAQQAGGTGLDGGEENDPGEFRSTGFLLQSCDFRVSKNTHLELKYLNENFTDWRGGLVVWLGFLKIFSSRQINP